LKPNKSDNVVDLSKLKPKSTETSVLEFMVDLKKAMGALTNQIIDLSNWAETSSNQIQFLNQRVLYLEAKVNKLSGGNDSGESSSKDNQDNQGKEGTDPGDGTTH
jgi:hypothetical protein